MMREKSKLLLLRLVQDVEVKPRRAFHRTLSKNLYRRAGDNWARWSNHASNCPVFYGRWNSWQPESGSIFATLLRSTSATMHCWRCCVQKHKKNVSSFSWRYKQPDNSMLHSTSATMEVRLSWIRHNTRFVESLRKWDRIRHFSCVAFNIINNKGRRLVSGLFADDSSMALYPWTLWRVTFRIHPHSTIDIKWDCIWLL